MTISRERFKIYFECDAPRCAEVCETDSSDWNTAFDTMKVEGWTAKKVGNDWEHQCADHS